MQKYFSIIVVIWAFAFIFFILGLNENWHDLKVLSAILSIGLVIFYTYFSTTYFFNYPYSDFLQVFKLENWQNTFTGTLIGMPFATAAASGSLVVYEFPMLLIFPVTVVFGVLGFVLIAKSKLREPIKNHLSFIQRNYILLIIIVCIQGLIIGFTWPRFAIPKINQNKTHINLSGDLYEPVKMTISLHEDTSITQVSHTYFNNSSFAHLF